MPRPPTADVLIAANCWQAQADAEDVVQRAIAAAASFVELPAEDTEVAVMLTDDARIRELNKEWRDQDKATNVLSFPAMPVRPGVALPPVLGDIVLAAETIRREAGLEEKPFEHHLTHLMVHGFLHIIGYDHETDAEAEEMEAAERRILVRLAIPDPYD
jgi:probable rRNA maturation factor